MSDITVNVTNAGAANIAVSNGSTFNATVGNGGSVNVSLGTISPGNATVVSGTLTINGTTTLSPGSNATVTNSGTAYAAVLDFGIPAGATGPAGINGTTPSFSIGNVTTLSAGSNATVSAASSNSGANVTLNFGIPQGAVGAAATLTLSDATPSALGTASAGTSNLPSRSDHVHALPVIAWGNLSGVPSNFPTNTSLVSGLSAGYAAINHAHDYVTSLNNLTGSLTLAAGSNVSLATNGSTLTLSSTGGGIGANDAVDGGDYVGVILGGITFSLQPQSVTVNSTTTLGNWTQLTVGSGNFPFELSAPYGAAVSNGTAHAFVSSHPTLVGTRAVTSADSQLWTLDSNGTTSRSGATSKFLSATEYGGTASVYQSYSSNATVLATVNLSSGGVAVHSDISDSEDEVQQVHLLKNSQTYCRVRHDGAVRRSTDLLSWTAQSFLHTDIFVNRFCGCARTFQESFLAQYSGEVSVSGGGTSQVSRLYRSTDGVTWASVIASGVRESNQFSIATSPTAAVVLGTASTAAFVSVNGTTWTPVTLPRSTQRIFWAGTRFIGFDSAATTEYIWSSDGATWNVATLPISRVWDLAGGTNQSLTVLDATTTTTPAWYATLSTTAASANFTVSASAASGNPVSYQWQSSLDAGTSWGNVANATSANLSLTGLTTSNSGTRYRAVASATGAASVNSQSATLTVTG